MRSFTEERKNHHDQQLRCMILLTTIEENHKRIQRGGEREGGRSKDEGLVLVEEGSGRDRMGLQRGRGGRKGHKTVGHGMPF